MTMLEDTMNGLLLHGEQTKEMLISSANEN